MGLARTTDDLEALRAFMGRRWFVAGRRELLESGFGVAQLNNWLRQKRLIQVIHGVYSFGRDVETRESAWRAALVAAGPGSALIGRSACEVWSLVCPTISIPGYIEVATPSGRAFTHKGRSPSLSRVCIRVVRRGFEDGEVVTSSGLRVTKASRSLIDLAVDASEREVRSAFLEACRLVFSAGATSDTATRGS